MKSLIPVFLLSAASIAAATDFSAPAKFEVPQTESAGHATLSWSAGLYRYGSEGDNRAARKGFALGGWSRDDYQLFSWQEEEALWLVLQEQIAAMEPKKRSKLRSAFRSRIDWPRVVVRGQSTVCVPTLSKAKEDSWMDHLLCTEVTKVLE